MLEVELLQIMSTLSLEYYARDIHPLIKYRLWELFRKE